MMFVIRRLDDLCSDSNNLGNKSYNERMSASEVGAFGRGLKDIRI